MGYGGGFAGLGLWLVIVWQGIWWMNSCCLLGIGSSDHTGSLSSAVGKSSSSSSSESISDADLSLKVNNGQTAWWKGNSSLGHLEVDGKVGPCAPL